MNSVEWNPKYNLLAYAGDDKNKYQADEGTIAAAHSFQFGQMKEMSSLAFDLLQDSEFIFFRYTCFRLAFHLQYIILQLLSTQQERKLNQNGSGINYKNSFN